MSTSATAVITGGATGIGLACSKHFQSMGWRVIALGLDREAELPGDLEFRRVDVTNAAEVEGALADLEGIDTLVNAAGMLLSDGREWPIDGFRKVMDVNVNGSHLVTITARPLLTKRRGSVINVASMWSYFGSARNPAYTASKGAVVALTRAHAAALAEFGVRVNAVAPGWIATRLSDGAISNPERAPDILKRIPMARWGEPEDVAAVVGFLASDAARYMTGAILPVDGGYSIA